MNDDVRRGTIERHRDKWRVRLSVAGTRKNFGVYATLEEAERALAAALMATSDQVRLSFVAYSSDWLARRELAGLHRSVRTDRNRIKYAVNTEWAHLPIKEIEPQHISAWVRELLSRKLSRQTVRNALNLARTCLEDAVQAHVIAINPARTVRVPKTATTKDTWTYLTLAEIEDVTTSPDIPERYRLAYAIAIYTGLRAGELWGLRWEDVHLRDRPRVVVRHSYKGPTKGGRVREVPLLPRAVAALEQLRRTRPGIARSYVFASDDGSPHTHSYDAQWPLHGQPRFKRRVRFHDLRHTCASHLAQGSWDQSLSLSDVQQWLGHASRTTTERYAHLAPDGLFAIAARMQQQPRGLSPNARK